MWQAVIAGLVMLASFFTGAWTKGASSGKNQGTVDAQMVAIRERVARLEQRHDNADDKISLMAERIAQMPTRAEMAQGFDRMESRFDSLNRHREN